MSYKCIRFYGSRGIESFSLHVWTETQKTALTNHQHSSISGQKEASAHGFAPGAAHKSPLEEGVLHAAAGAAGGLVRIWQTGGWSGPAASFYMKAPVVMRLEMGG